MCRCIFTGRRHLRKNNKRALQCARCLTKLKAAGSILTYAHIPSPHWRQRRKSHRYAVEITLKKLASVASIRLRGTVMAANRKTRHNNTVTSRQYGRRAVALNPFRLTFLRMRESDTTLVAMRDVYFSHPAAPTVKTVPIDVSAHARVNYFVNRRKFVVSEMFYSYLRHYMSSGVHHPAVAKHDNVQWRVRSAALKHVCSKRLNSSRPSQWQCWLSLSASGAESSYQ